MITLVYTYYDNGGMLERHLEEWSRYSCKDRFRAIVVDDGSEKDPALSHMRPVGFQLELYRIRQNIKWNVPGARNLGMHAAPDGWCLLSDIDHLLRAEEAEKLLRWMETPTGRLCRTELVAYQPARRWADGRGLHPHPNTYVIHRELYWRIGGCDEDFAGWWGAGEQPFRKRLDQLAPRKPTNAFFLSHYGRDDIPDASTRQWGRRNSPDDWTRNPYLVKKVNGPPYRPSDPLRFDWDKIWPTSAIQFQEESHA